VNTIEKGFSAEELAEIATKNSAVQGFVGGDGRVAIFIFNNGVSDFFNLNGVDANLIFGNLPLRTPLEGSVELNLSAFISMLAKEKKAPKTVKCYTSDVKNVMKFIAEKFFDGREFSEINICEVTKENIETAEQYFFRESKQKPKTLNRLKQGWNSFCNYLGVWNWRFTEKIKAVRTYKREAISNEAVVKMLDFCRQRAEDSATIFSRIRWLRTEIMIGLGWTGGFRSCEYVNANFDEIEETGLVTIRNSKHDGSREVPLTTETQEAVARLKKLLRENNFYPPNGGIFEKPNGKYFSTCSFRRWLKNAADLCGVSRCLAKTHGLRHRFAKNFHNYRPDGFMLSDLLGHRSPETTKIYTQESLEYQRAVVQEASRIARASVLQAS